jgi:hypothetical protein
MAAPTSIIETAKANRINKSAPFFSPVNVVVSYMLLVINLRALTMKPLRAAPRVAEAVYIGFFPFPFPFSF